MRIRNAQMAVFQAEFERRNLRALRRFLEAHSPSLLASVPEDRRASLLGEAIRKGARYEMQMLSSLAMVFCFLVKVHTRFDQLPPISKALHDEANPPDARLAVLLALDSVDGWAQRCVEAKL